MKLDCKIYILDDEGEKFFGRGPYLLLKKTEECGSLNRAAKEMAMAYSKAFRMVKDAENALGFPLLVRKTGGKDGGGSKLTPEAAAWLERYAAAEARLKDAAARESALLFNK